MFVWILLNWKRRRFGSLFYDCENCTEFFLSYWALTNPLQHQTNKNPRSCFILKENKIKTEGLKLNHRSKYTQITPPGGVSQAVFDRTHVNFILLETLKMHLANRVASYNSKGAAKAFPLRFVGRHWAVIFNEQRWLKLENVYKFVLYLNLFFLCPRPCPGLAVCVMHSVTLTQFSFPSWSPLPDPPPLPPPPPPPPPLPDADPFLLPPSSSFFL